jgi:RIO kinase 1
MELVMGADGNAARRLIDTDLTVSQANAAYHDMVAQLVRILSCDLIHGDLSPYNVLWGANGPVIIDFPQIVSASHNSGSEQFFLRDADNILGHFARIDRSLFSRRGDPREIWNAYRRRELTPEFRPTGQHRPPPPRTFAPRPEAPQRQERREPREQAGHGQNDHSRRRPPQAAPSGQHRGMRMPEVIVRHSPLPGPASPPRDVPLPAEAPRPSPPQHAPTASSPADGVARPHRRRRRRR